jgi:hypothetical protein
MFDYLVLHPVVLSSENDLFSDCYIYIYVCLCVIHIYIYYIYYIIIWDNVKKNHKLECFFVLFFIIMAVTFSHPPAGIVGVVQSCSRPRCLFV